MPDPTFAIIVAMTWAELSNSNLVCAQALLDRDEDASWRSATSRAYYAGYTAASGLVCRPGVTFRN